MSLSILFHFLCAQHVSDINISIIRSLLLCCWIATSVVFFSVHCVLEIWYGCVWVVSMLKASACNNPSITSLRNEKPQFKLALTIFYMHTPFTLWMNFLHVQMICITDLYDCVNSYTVIVVYVLYAFVCSWHVPHTIVWWQPQGSMKCINVCMYVCMFVCMYVFFCPNDYH